MKKILYLLVVLLIFPLISSMVFAADGTWLNTGGAGTPSWSSSSNWTGGTVPGATIGTTNTDTALFNTSVGAVGTSGNPVTIDTDRNIGFIVFDTNAGSYNIGAVDGNAIRLSGYGDITILSTFSSAANVTETINAPIILGDSAGDPCHFINDSANGSGAGAGTLNIGGSVTGAATTGITTTLNIHGTNTNSNTISGIIGDGTAGGKVAVEKTEAGTWTLSGANAYTGAVSVSEGILNIRNATALGTTAGGTAVDLGATLQVQGGIAIGAETLEIGGTLENVSGNNSWAGNITASSSPTAVITSTAGTLTLTGTIDGTTNDIQFTGAGNISASGVISDFANLTKVGAGTLTLTGANTYTGLITLDGGVINIRNATALGTTDSGVVFNNPALDETALELQGGITVGAEAINTIHGTGISNGGALRNISGNNSWAGAIAMSDDTRINSDAGTLTLGAGGITGDTLELTVGGAGNTTISGVIATTTGTLIKDGAGTLILSGNNSYTGATTVSAGVLNIQNANALGTSGTSVTSGAALQIQGDIVVAAESLTLNGTGIVTTGALRSISGENNYTGAITLAGATEVRINSDAGTLTLSGGIDGAGKNLIIGGAGDTAVSGVIGTVAGTLTKDGAGTLTLTNENTYTGLTTVSAGTLVLGRAGGTISGAVTVSGGTLNVDNDDTVGAVTLSSGTISGDSVLTGTSYSLTGGTLSGKIGGAGALTKTGSGTATISSANTTYTGATTISAGTLAVSNASALGTGDVEVASGGTLDVGTTSLSVGGAYNQSSGSMLNLTVSSDTTSGSVAATGIASVSAGSAVAVTVATSSYISTGTNFTIISGAAGSTWGTPTVTTTSTRLRFTPTISGDSIILTASRASMGFASIASNANSAAVGTVLDTITNPSSDMMTILNTLEGLSDSQAAAAMNTMVPEIDAGVINISTSSLDAFVGASFERVGELLRPTDTGISSGDEAKLNNVWAKGYGTYLNQKMRKGIDGYDAWNAGTALGADHMFDDIATLGISGGYAYGNVDSNANSAKTNINSAQATIYGGYQDAVYPYYIDAAGTFAWNWYSGKRTIIVGPIQRIADGDYDGQQYGLYMGAGCKILLEDILELTPTVSLRWSYLRLAGYTETGAGSMGVKVDSQGYNILQSGIGAKLSRTMKLDNGVITPEVHGQWLYDFIGDDMVLTSSFTGGGASFNSTGAKPAQSSFDVGGKLTYAMNNGISLIGTCDSELKEGFFAIYGSMELMYNF